MHIFHSATSHAENGTNHKLPQLHPGLCMEELGQQTRQTSWQRSAHKNELTQRSSQRIHLRNQIKQAKKIAKKHP
jgi:hypothetical protein